MKPVVLTFSHYYLPGYRGGGPIRSIQNLVDGLGDEFEFRIVTQDRDLGDAQPYAGVETDRWLPHGPAFVRYVDPQRFGMRYVRDLLRTTRHDVVYLNSFFDYRYTQQVLANRRFLPGRGSPVVLAPRGEFSAGARSVKRWKKLAYITLMRSTRWYADICWQASSAFEAADITGMMGVGRQSGIRGWVANTGHLVVAPDLPAPHKGTMSGARERQRRRDSPLRVCYLARISPNKNLAYALRVLAQVRVPVTFTIYGPKENAAYWAECQSLLDQLPANVTVVEGGVVDHASVIDTLATHDLFFFPTTGENFGHVIYEALLAGLPLLVSDRTPWRALAAQGVGFDLPLEQPADFAARIEEVAGYPAAAFDRMMVAARALAARIGRDPGTIDANRRMFLDAIARHRTRNALSPTDMATAP